jgi:hypothetical protein
MKILILYRTENDPTGEFVKEIKRNLDKAGHETELISRNKDLHLTSLSGSMDGLKNFVIKEDKRKNYDIIYTQDWSIAFPLLFPTKILFDKHYCLFHDFEKEGGPQSRIFQRITGSLLGEHLLVKTEELKRKFPKAILSKEGISNLIFK